MRFLGRKWQKKNRGRDKNNEFRSMAALGSRGRLLLKMIAAEATHKLARNLRPSDEKRIGLPSSVDFGTQIGRRKAAKNSI